MIKCIKFILTLILAILLLPVMGVVALLTWFSVGRPILFRQQRIGLHGQTITIYKFRSMLNAYDDNGQLLPDKQRQTHIGTFLRHTSLDELPQIWNILKGDLVWVGPRPLMLDIREQIEPEHHKRHHVKPGITGWAQINGRNSITLNEKFLLDLWYVENKSLLLDLFILFKTIPVVITGKNVAYPDAADFQNLGSNRKQNTQSE